MSKMSYAEIPGTGKQASRIFYGTARMPFLKGEAADDQFDTMLEAGINAIDTARGYGEAEKSVGHWLRSGVDREKIVLLTKCGHPSLPDGRKRINAREMNEDLDKSIEMLGTDYIDVYLLHRDDPEVPVGEIVEILNEMKDRGRIRAFGGSNWTFERIAAANEYAAEHGLAPFTVSSPNFGLADQIDDPWGGGCVTISGKQGKEARQWYENNQMPVIAYSSLGRGLFSGMLKSNETDQADKILDRFAMRGYGYPENFERLRRCEELAAKKGCTVPQIAMAWIFHQKINTFAIVSIMNDEQLRQNIEALQIGLTAQEAAWLNLEEA